MNPIQGPVEYFYALESCKLTLYRNHCTTRNFQKGFATVVAEANRIWADSAKRWVGRPHSKNSPVASTRVQKQHSLSTSNMIAKSPYQVYVMSSRLSFSWLLVWRILRGSFSHCFIQNPTLGMYRLPLSYSGTQMYSIAKSSSTHLTECN